MRKPEVDEDRCLRYRCRSSSCTRCRDACPLDCIQFASAPVVNAEVCTGCMMCVASCPVDGFRVLDAAFMDLLARLQGVDGVPVLGCRVETESSAHERLGCLGELADEHLAALAVFLPHGIQLNAISCSKCVNACILPVLKEKISKITSLLPRDNTCRLALVEESEALIFREPSLDRRTFFRTLGRDLTSTAAGLILSESDRTALSRAEKYIPLKRNLINEIACSLPDLARERFLAQFHHELRFAETCTFCPRCAAVCPTGALKRKYEEGSGRLDFSASLCTGCAVCVDFCPSDALSLVSPGDETEPALEQSTLDNLSRGSREQLDIDLTENLTG